MLVLPQPRRGWIEFQYRYVDDPVRSIRDLVQGDFAPVPGMVLNMLEIPTMNQYLDMITHRYKDFDLNRPARRWDAVATRVQGFSKIEGWLLVDRELDRDLVMAEEIPETHRRIYGDSTNELYLWALPCDWWMWAGNDKRKKG